MQELIEFYDNKPQVLISIVPPCDRRWERVNAFLRNPTFSEKYMLRKCRLRKVRSRMIIAALLWGSSVKGNQKVETWGYGVIIMYYRETPIAEFDANKMIFRNIDAGVYEHTSSNIDQRKQWKRSLEELVGDFTCSSL